MQWLNNDNPCAKCYHNGRLTCWGSPEEGLAKSMLVRAETGLHGWGKVCMGPRRWGIAIGWEGDKDLQIEERASAHPVNRGSEPPPRGKMWANRDRTRSPWAWELAVGTWTKARKHGRCAVFKTWLVRKISNVCKNGENSTIKLHVTIIQL